MSLFNLWQPDKERTMTNNQFTDNPDYVTYKRLLTELDQLIADGKDDDEEAEAVRDQVDGPWYRLSGEETDHIRSLPTGLNQKDNH